MKSAPGFIYGFYVVKRETSLYKKMCGSICLDRLDV